MLAGHFFVLRGENRRMLELANMSLLKYPKEKGLMPYFALIFRLSNGKMNKIEKKQFMGALQHQDSMLYTQGVLAQYLF